MSLAHGSPVNLDGGMQHGGLPGVKVSIGVINPSHALIPRIAAAPKLCSHTLLQCHHMVTLMMDQSVTCMPLDKILHQHQPRTMRVIGTVIVRVDLRLLL